MLDMPTKPTTVTQYLAALPKERRAALQAVRKVIRDNLGEGYAEGMQYGMIGYFVPHSVYPPGYHCDPKQPLPFMSIASQKNHMAIYMFCIYSSPAEQQWFHDAWARTGKKLDMGKSCVRFKKVEDLALDVVGKAVKRAPVKKFIAHYEATLGHAGRAPAKKKTAKKSAGTTKKKRKSTTKR